MNVTRPVVALNDEEKLLKSVAPTVPSKLRASTSSTMPEMGERGRIQLHLGAIESLVYGAGDEGLADKRIRAGGLEAAGPGY